MDQSVLRKLCCNVLQYARNFSLSPSDYKRVSDLGILSKPRTRRGCRAGRLVRLWCSQSSVDVQNNVNFPSLQLPTVSKHPPASVSYSSSVTSSADDHFPLNLAELCDSVSRNDSIVQCDISVSDDFPCRKSPHIVIGLFNARSSVKKALKINDLITDKSLDVLVITETWLHERGDEVVIRNMTPAGYVFSHCPRLSEQRGGGIAVIHRDFIHVKQCKCSTYPSFERMDFVISQGSYTVRTIALYRPPPSVDNQLTDSMFQNDFGNLVPSVTNKNLLILGDFNFHWDVPADRNVRRLAQLFDCADLVQHVSETTHRDGHILDWIVARSDKDGFVHSVSVEDPLLSDHFLVTCMTNMVRPVPAKKIVKTRSLKKMDIDAFRGSLSDSDLVKSPPDDAEELTILYNETLSGLLDLYAPVTERCVRDRPDSAWLNPSVLKAKSVRRRAEKRWRRNRLEVDRQIYQKARNKFSQAVRCAKSQHVQSVLQEASKDSRRVFAVVDDLLGKRTTSCVLPELDDAQAAETMSTFFVEKVETIRKSFDQCALPEVEELFVGTPLVDFVPVSEDQLRRIISSCRATSSVVDPVPTKIVLECLDILLPVLVKIMNSSLLSGTVPRPFKSAVIKPLLKKKNMDENDCKSYRPVSNLPYVSKLLERVVSQQFVEHLNSHNLLDKFQSAYRPGHSCETALLRVLNDVLCSIDRGDLTLLVLLDLSAAFDVIDHGLLLSRLQREAGATGSVLCWFQSYLTDRTQRVIVNSATSQQTVLSCGVPQGSVLGPILFSLYTKQLGGVIESHGLCRKLFADDTELYKSFHPDDTSACTAVQEVESCCLSIKSWMLSNRLKLNDSKTEAILCGSDANLQKVTVNSIKVGDADIVISDSVRDLGLILDCTLSMTNHISSVVRSCFFALRQLGQLRPHLNRETSKTVAVALIQSKLDYCNSCLWGVSDYQLERLQKVQNTAARIVTRTKKSGHITPVLRDLHWLPVEKRIDHKLLSIAYSCVESTAPAYLQELVPNHVPSRPLRSSSRSLLRVPSVDGHKKKSQGARSFECVAPKLWNSLPQTLRDCRTKGSFKRQLKTYLFN